MVTDYITGQSFMGDVGECPRCGHPQLRVVGLVPRIPRHENQRGLPCPLGGKPVDILTRTGRIRRRRRSRYTRKG